VRQPSAASAAPSRRLALAIVAVVSVACSKHNTSPGDAALPVPDATPDETVIHGEAPADVGAMDGGSRTGGIGGGFACDASEQCLTGACNQGVCSDWAHGMRIRIDTTSTGADVSETVTDFPLLVRLGGNANAFDFSQARADGGDIRFVDDKGHNLNYQIERWDNKRRVAEVWVSVPRIVGSSAANDLILYWGNDFAAPLASGTAVFDSYTCVYHIEDANVAPSGVQQLQDDSGHNAIGAIYAPTSVPPAPVNTHADGVIGYGLALDGTSNFLTTSAMPANPPSLSVSLWFKAQRDGPGGLAAFYVASGPGLSGGSTTLAIAMASDGTLSFSVSHANAMVPVKSLIRYNDLAWHFVTARLSALGQYLFVDGESIAENPTLTSADPNEGSSWRFGQIPGVPAEGVPSAYFGGILDEIRISATEESAAWIKLAYATQRAGSPAVKYLPVQ
jgi:hypothetical protein